jgi:hypothetical protein
MNARRIGGVLLDGGRRGVPATATARASPGPRPLPRPRAARHGRGLGTVALPCMHARLRGLSHLRPADNFVCFFVNPTLASCFPKRLDRVASCLAALTHALPPGRLPLDLDRAYY